IPRSRKQRARTRDFRGGKRLRGHYTRLRKTSSRISTLNNSRVSLRDCLEASCMAVRRVEQRKFSKHKRAPPPKTIAALFDVIGWCWPQRRKRYWHLSRRDESCQQPIPISRRASMSCPQSSDQSWGRILICLQFLSIAKIRTLGWNANATEDRARLDEASEL